MSVALDNGLSVTALHNHFFFDEPKVYFMHISGNGDSAKLATAVRKVWDKMKEIRAANPKPATTFGGAAMPMTNSISGKVIDDILGAKDRRTTGCSKWSSAHDEDAVRLRHARTWGEHWAAFAGTDDTRWWTGTLR